MTKIAVVTGGQGQDGSLMTKLLLNNGYLVIVTSRNHFIEPPRNHLNLGIYKHKNVIYKNLNLEDYSEVSNFLNNYLPDEIYHFSAQSSVGKSFDSPLDTVASNYDSLLNILEALRKLKKEVRLYSAGSSETFGNIPNGFANEQTIFNPCSPYGIAKHAGYELVKGYRKIYGLYVVTGITFNHESPFRTEDYVTQKIVSSAERIASGSLEQLKLGNIYIQRDWGWASEYVEAMWTMLQSESPKDYVIGTGKTSSLEDFLNLTFTHYGLNWRDHVVQCQDYMRPNDIVRSACDPSLIKHDLGWEAKVHLDGVINKLILAKTK